MSSYIGRFFFVTFRRAHSIFSLIWFVFGLLGWYSQYFATLTFIYERIKYLLPRCKECYKTHYDGQMVAKFLWYVSQICCNKSKYILTSDEIPDSFEAFHRLNKLSITSNQSSTDSHSSALVASGGCERTSFTCREGSVKIYK